MQHITYDINVMMHITQKLLIQDDVIKWKHFPRYWPFVRGIPRSPVNSTHKGQWRGALMFSLLCARINGWVNNREAGDLRRYRSHYDVIVMYANICIILLGVGLRYMEHPPHPHLSMYNHNFVCVTVFHYALTCCSEIYHVWNVFGKLCSFDIRPGRFQFGLQNLFPLILLHVFHERNSIWQCVVWFTLFVDIYP